jgi:hypothetical protein
VTTPRLRASTPWGTPGADPAADLLRAAAVLRLYAPGAEVSGRARWAQLVRAIRGRRADAVHEFRRVIEGAGISLYAVGGLHAPPAGQVWLWAGPVPGDPNRGPDLILEVAW